MAHATSLAKIVAASGVCSPWPQSTFRFAIATSGDTLTVSAAQNPQVMWQPSQTAIGQERAKPASAAACDPRAAAPVPGKAHDRADYPHVPDAALAERFYQALGQLNEILYGPRRLGEARVTDSWPQQGVYFFYEQGEVRADTRQRVVRVGTPALTATSRATLLGSPPPAPRADRRQPPGRREPPRLGVPPPRRLRSHPARRTRARAA
jgi:hypothetical protein